MVSFDVSSLFTNVPIEDTLDFMKNYLQSHTVDMPFNSDVLLKLIELCTNNAYFSCNGNFFQQKRGLPMGSCISPVLSNIYMEFFERYLLPSIVNFELVWLRYVDDVFAVLLDNIDLDNFLASLNRLSPSIKFTIEKETNNSIPFLDVEVIRGNLKFTVNPLIQNYLFMLSQAILIRLKKQPLIIYFKEPINYVIHNSLIMKLNSFIKSLKI